MNRAAEAGLEISAPRLGLCRRAVEAFYAALLPFPEPEAVLGMTLAFRRAVLGELRQAPENMTAAIRSGAAAALLINPARVWRPDRFAPSALLRADFRIVPFHGRDALCGEIEDWATGEAPVGVRLFTGPGGTGKTRLMMEMCRRLRAKGWHTGFYDREAVKPAWAIETLLGDPRDLFIVISGLLDHCRTHRHRHGGVVQGDTGTGKHTGVPAVLSRGTRRGRQTLQVLRGAALAQIIRHP